MRVVGQSVSKGKSVTKRIPSTFERVSSNKVRFVTQLIDFYRFLGSHFSGASTCGAYSRR